VDDMMGQLRVCVESYETLYALLGESIAEEGAAAGVEQEAETEAGLEARGGGGKEAGDEVGGGGGGVGGGRKVVASRAALS
jgi:hypothetical protein